MGKIRVIQYGVGPIGAGMVRLMLTKPAIQIVGAIDVDPKKVGKDLGTVAGAEREIGVKISSDAKAILRSGVDVVVSELRDTPNWAKAEAAGLRVMDASDAAKTATRANPSRAPRMRVALSINRMAAQALCHLVQLAGKL